MNKLRVVGLSIALLLSMAGAALSGALWKVHVAGKGSGLLAAVCGGEESGCDKVVASRWSVFPPEDAATADAAPPGSSTGAAAANRRALPVAAIGMFYFSTLLVWFAVIGCPSRERRWMRWAALAFCGAGCLASVGFLVLMGAVVKAWCPFCIGSHACNFLLLGIMVFLAPRSPSTEPPSAPHPGTRLAVTAAALAAALVFGELQAFSALASQTELEQITPLLEKYTQDAHAVELAFMQAKQADIPVRDDDPVVAASPGTRNTVILFSDIECPYCARFDHLLFTEIKPLYKGHLRIVFKHFPLVKRHPNAFRGATALEAARLQGKFWEMHDLLLKNRERLGSVQYQELAQTAGLDPKKFEEDMGSQAVRERVEEDIRLGQKLGVRSVPEVFLNSRLLDRSMRDLLGFWKLRADAVAGPAGGSGNAEQ